MQEQQTASPTFVEAPAYNASGLESLIAGIDPLLQAIISAAAQEAWGADRKVDKIRFRNFRFDGDDCTTCWIKAEGLFVPDTKCPFRNDHFTLTLRVHRDPNKPWELHEIDFRCGKKVLLRDLIFGQRAEDLSKYIVLYPDGLDYGPNWDYVKNHGHKYVRQI